MSHPPLPPMRVRPVSMDDLDAVDAMAQASAYGISSLQVDRSTLSDRIQASVHAFQSEDAASGDENYLFVLEDTGTGEVRGISGIAARAGAVDPFISYRNEYVVHTSRVLKQTYRVHTLHLSHDLTGHSLLTSFYIDPMLAGSPWPELLSRARLLFMAAQRDRFSDRIAAAHPGVCDEAGNCPFWQALGERFFNMPYPQAERLSGGRSQPFIAELMPQAPIYVPLLAEAAQLAIGQLHPVAELTFSILQEEGFDADTYVDIFDGGPIMEARLPLVRSVAASRLMPLSTTVLAPGATSTLALVAKVTRAQFSAVLCPVQPTASGQLALSEDDRRRLGVTSGDMLRWVALDAAMPGDWP